MRGNPSAGRSRKVKARFRFISRADTSASPFLAFYQEAKQTISQQHTSVGRWPGNKDQLQPNLLLKLEMPQQAILLVPSPHHWYLYISSPRKHADAHMYS